MSDAAALLAAIAAQPDEDTPRLAYADWLDEFSDPARAEFVRLQVRRGAGRPSARERALLGPRRTAWEAPLRALGATAVSWDRGLPDGIMISAARLLNHATSLFGEAPIRRVKVTCRPGGPDNWFVMGPACHLSGYAGRDEMAAEQQRLLGRRTAGLDPDFVPDLECPDALRRGVELTGENAVRLLASCPLLSRLEELDASDNLIRAAGVGPLAHTPYLGNLRRLDLSANDFAPAGTRWAACLATAGLARARLPALRTLRLNGNGLSAESVGVLAAAAWLPELEAIELAGNRIESAGPLLRLARGGPCLRSIALDGNPLGGRAAGEVARALAAGPAAGATR